MVIFNHKCKQLNYPKWKNKIKANFYSLYFKKTTKRDGNSAFSVKIGIFFYIFQRLNNVYFIFK